MPTLVQRAAAYQRAAMQRLYDQNKQTALYIAQRLLKGDAHADAAVVAAFDAAFTKLAAAPLSSETAFSQLLIGCVAEECKKVLVRRNPKALRIPQDRRFALPFDTAPTASDDACEAVLSPFSDFQRMIFVLHTAGGMDENALAAAAKLDARTLQTALTAERDNIERMLKELGKRDMTYDDIVDRFCKSKNDTAVSADVDDQVFRAIAAKAAPIEKQKRRKTLKISLIIVGVCAAILGLCIAALFSLPNTDITTSSGGNSTNSSDSTASDVDLSNVGTVTTVTPTHYAEIAIENYGTIKVALDANTAPITVQNFIDLSEQGFYDGLTFHRIMEGFMMQGGAPNGDGTGGSGTSIKGEFAYNGVDNPLSHVRGAISMARSDPYDSASSQFFIVHKDSTSLDGFYAVFGYVVEGMDIVDAICEASEPTDGNGTIPADQQPVIGGLIVYEATDTTTTTTTTP